MKKFFLIFKIFFTIIWVGPVLFGVISDVQNGQKIDSGDIFFLLFGTIFMFFVFRLTSGRNRNNTEKNSTLSKKDRDFLKKFGNRTNARFLRIDSDVVETKDTRALYIILQDRPFGNEFKQIIIKNKEDIASLLKEKIFPVYIDSENIERYYIDFSSILNKDMNDPFFLPIV